ncbi:MAG: 23S rRNA (cytidine(2498)-2'-O)-methyltransferase RlmM [Pseudomonadales bacterium]|nr:23S rRNA (cytidine(2498)-2'-O)-methyltransferase RlmM [Gammaproteobacteria bacterium]MBP6227209.1 23S rRNA (cytidine(2498)-2'-O)-methyltransferase RlmM [Pseudomonadales bacterium]
MRTESLVLLCRAGFEKECSAEIIERLATIGVAGYCRAGQGSGWVEVKSAAHWDPLVAFETLRLRDLVFTRDWFAGVPFRDLHPGDRLAPLLAMARAPGPFMQCWLQHVDTEDGRSVGRLGTRMRARVEGALQEARLIRADAGARLHILFLGGTDGFLGISRADNGALWSMGVPRLRLPGAPSRSAAKLEEAFLWFLGEREARELRAGMSAVDLGAAPGGWTWQLVRRGIRVKAIDRAALRADLLESGLVEHLEADAFSYRPERQVDWMVCDVVDKPARVADLVVRWFVNDWCKRCIFNLKLPMKQRYREVSTLLERILRRIVEQGGDVSCEARQLYHDREEITVFLRRR